MNGFKSDERLSFFKEMISRSTEEDIRPICAASQSETCPGTAAPQLAQSDRNSVANKKPVSIISR